MLSSASMCCSKLSLERRLRYKFLQEYMRDQKADNKDLSILLEDLLPVDPKDRVDPSQALKHRFSKQRVGDGENNFYHYQ